jgi:hypothetical protein
MKRSEQLYYTQKKQENYVDDKSKQTLKGKNVKYMKYGRREIQKE